ncbi:family 43 glycosylhydrolase [Chitinophaga cymbidii]|uniref:Beta-xylosidase C-terminal Concanavalin A-like domain-containing protein n=1 Tax=Chitinophaga cymbidii TaxID=1096750 RepID=A0A512RMX3_9BACT|nr:family 43 glycosylhydrolase [Chitinophaga cymbidii]GEP97064.1 hypothetical protein CCY01nite_33240 [Chitinophaga cymbidii]
MNYSMMFLCACCQLLALYAGAQRPEHIHNPVLPGVADAGVMKFNGEYYIGGVFTNGGFYVSDDLVNWKGPVHVFSMNNGWTEGASAGDNQIHANDMRYINGVFHLYWSVNYWGQDRNVVHIGHAVSDSVLGPYNEPVKDTWLDNRIDPMLFTDDDGRHYLYMVKFTDGNTIWARPMKDPYTFAGPPVYQFASLPNTWETTDNRVAEGPWVIKYRNRYYMMYNANHTSTAWGNYMLGVAEADSPMGFGHGGKYPGPVVFSNQSGLEDRFADLLKYNTNPYFQYTTARPAENWHQSGFDASGWQQGKPGFGSGVIKGSTVRNVRTMWNEPEIWARKVFSLNSQLPSNLLLRVYHNGDTRIYLNGQPVYERSGRQYTTLNIDARQLLKNGENILAIQSSRGRQNFLDISLFDMKNERGDDILYSPGQPNILRGPNGFEWWLVYMANKNADRRGQYIDRVHFFNRKLVVDGITSEHTPGYHPAPAMPDFRDLFNGADSLTAAVTSTVKRTDVDFLQKWRTSGGDWQQRHGQLTQTATGTAQALIKSTPASNYLFETGVQPNKAKAGIIAAWKDESDWLKIWLDPQRKAWGYRLNQKGKQTTAYHPLPQDFNFDRYHTLTVFRNAASFEVKIDHLPAPGMPVIRTALNGKHIPGLYTEGAGAAFDGVLYTIGWDEFDNMISGWGTPASISGNGLTLNAGNRVFKGDLLDSYEIGTQVTQTATGNAGIYAVYIDDENYLQAQFDNKTQKLAITGKKDGTPLSTEAISLETASSYYVDMKYSDFFERHFSFDHPVYINSISLNKTPYQQPDTLIERIHEKMNIFYQSGEKWHPLPAFRRDTTGHPGFDKIVFNPVKAEGLKFVNKAPGERMIYVNKIQVNETCRESYHLRAVKTASEVIFFVDGREVKRYPASFPASRVGLCGNGTFNGITYFHIPQ